MSDTRIPIAADADALKPAPLTRPLELADDIRQLKAFTGILNDPRLKGVELPSMEGFSADAIAEMERAQAAANPNLTRVERPVPPPLATSAPLPATLPTVSFDRIFFTGKLKAGKDYLANAAGYRILGFADPIYEIASRLTGVNVSATENKDVPGMRALLQALGQWGRGHVSEKYPWNATRILLVNFIQERIREDFGKDNDIWLKDLLGRVAASEASRVAVSNCRFDFEYKALQGNGWQPWHVMTSQQTWAARLKVAGLTPDAPALKDTSEKLANDLDATFIKKISEGGNTKLRVVWNDPTIAPPSPRFYTIAQFLERTKPVAKVELPAGIDIIGE